jgi:hypothetical protein
MLVRGFELKSYQDSLRIIKGRAWSAMASVLFCMHDGHAVGLGGTAVGCSCTQS